MSRMGRLFLLFVCLITAVPSAAYGQPLPIRNQSGEIPRKAVPVEKQGVPLQVTLVETQEQAQNEAASAAKTNEHDRLDLIAQNKAADAAYIAAWLSGIGTLFVFCALVQNSLSNMRQSRAYITLKDASLMPLQSGRKIDLHLVFRNGGATPAYKVRSSAVAKVCVPTDPDPPKLKRMSDATHVVGASDIYTAGASLSPTLSDRDIQQIEHGALQLWVVARLEYLDAFKRKRFVCTSLRSVALSVDGERKWVFSPTEHGNDAN